MNMPSGWTRNWFSKSTLVAVLVSMSVVANAAGKGDVTTTAKLPRPFTGYVKKTVHQDGSIDVLLYKDAKLRNPYAYHGRWDPPEYQTLGQKYPVTLKLHVTIAKSRTDMTFTFQDASGNNAKIKGTTVQEDGSVNKLDLSVKNGVANGTAITEDGQTEVITDMPMKDMRRYLPSGGFRLSGIAAGSATELHFDPALLSEKEREAWKRNQEIVAKEIQAPARSGGTSSDKVDMQRQQLLTAQKEAQAAYARCVDHVGPCIDSCQKAAAVSGGSYISAVQACAGPCAKACDALDKAFWGASKRLDDYNLAQSQRQLEQAQQRIK